MFAQFKTLRMKILFGMLLSLVPMLVITGTTYYYSRQTTIDNSIKTMQLIIEHGALEINEFIDNQKSEFLQLTRDDIFGIAIEFRTFEEFETHFKSVLTDHKGFSRLVLTDINGNVLINSIREKNQSEKSRSDKNIKINEVLELNDQFERHAFLLPVSEKEIAKSKKT